MTLTQYIGDSKTHLISLTWEGEAFSPGEDWALIFTAKTSATDADADAVFQKSSGAGITVSGSTASIATVPDDTAALSATSLIYDVQAQHVTTAEIRTVSLGRIRLIRDVTRETTTSVPVNTTETPTPFSDLAQSTHAATEKTTPADADEMPLADSAAAFALKKITLANLKAWITSGLSSTWGGITGTLSDQTDLQAALDGKEPTLTAASVGNVLPDAIAEAGPSTILAAAGGEPYLIKGPFVDADDAATNGGLATGSRFFDAAGNVKVARKAIRKLAAFGDSITNGKSSWEYAATIGASTAGVEYLILPTYDSPHLVTIAHVTSGIDTPLTVDVAGSAITVNLATNGSGVATSSANQVIAAVIAKAEAAAILTPEAVSTGAGTAIAAAAAYAIPYSFKYTGYYTAAQTILRQRYELARRMSVHADVSSTASAYPGDYDFGYSGYDIEQLSENPGPLGDVLASDADTVIALVGTNSLPLDASVIASQAAALWDAIIAGGKQVIACEIPWNAANATKVADTNPLLKSAALARGIPFWEYSALTEDADLFVDGTHPNALGGQVMGISLAAFLDTYVAPATGNEFPAKTDTGWITTNPYCDGGTTYPTGWSASSNPSGGTATGSKVAHTDGGEWFQIAVSQPGTYNSQSNLVQNLNAGTDFNIGDEVYAVMEIESDDAGFDFKAIELFCQFYSNKGSSKAGYGGGSSTLAALAGPLSPINGIMKTEPIKVSTGTTRLQFSCTTYGSGTIRIRGGVFKVAP